jgi:HlyD family type I secretion membrane fusion protein
MLSQPQSNALPTIEENDFLPPIGRWKVLGGATLTLAVAIALLIASVVKYKVTIKAQAELRPSGELRIVQAAIAGIVTQVAVHEHQQVNRGDVIATLDNSQLQTKKSQLEGSIQQSQLQLGQVNAQVSTLNRQSLAEAERGERIVAGAKAERSQSDRDYQDRQISTVADVAEAEANVSAAIASLSAVQSKQNRYKRGFEAGAISEDQFDEVQLAVRQQEQALEAAKARKRRMEAALKPSQAAVAIATEQIAQEQANGQANLATLEKERQALLQQRTEIVQQLEHDRRELQQAAIELQQSTIVATSDGIITRLNLRNAGQVVNAGQEIVQIVPRGSALIIKAAVSPENRSQLKLGQVACMKVSACPYPDYGTLKGTVRQISEDTLKPSIKDTEDLRLNPQKNPEPFYEVTIQPEKRLLSQREKQCAIELGMPGTVDIVSKEENVLQLFLRKARLSADL